MLTRVCSTLAWLLLAAPIACQSPETVSRDQYTLIDDMEHDDGARFTTETGFPGMWYSSTQCGQGDSVSPPAHLGGANQWTFDLLEQTHWTLKQSAHASRLRTNGSATNDGGLTSPPTADPNNKNWGANMTIDFVTPPDADAGAETSVDAGSESATCPSPVSNQPPPKGIDLSAYDGLVFWAKASSLSDGSGEQTIYVMVHDPNSDPRGQLCYDTPEGGTQADLENCYNAYSKPITLSESFQRYEVDFSELQRDPTWGYAKYDRLQLENVYLIVFEVRAPKCIADRNARCVGDAFQVLKFDVSIDDLYLVKHPTNQP